MKRIFTFVAAGIAVMSMSAQDNAWGLKGSGTAADPYQVTSASDLRLMAQNINADNTGAGEYFVMTNDIDFGGTADNLQPLPAIGREAITNISTVAWGFEGNFDGRNHSIKGIYHTANTNTREGQFNALFSSVGQSGTVCNVVFDSDNYINSYNYVAAIASISRGRVENCVNHADITATNAFASGIVAQLINSDGNASGIITDCTNYGNVTAMSYATGILAGCQSGANVSEYAGYVVEGCTNFGDMTSTGGTGAAGIAGNFSGLIRNCTNDGTVNAKTQYSAGIVATASNLVGLSGCTNNGEILGGKIVGGIIGQVMAATVGKGCDEVVIEDNVNNGKINATGVNVAGIAANTVRTAENSVILMGNANNAEISSTSDAIDDTNIGNLRGCAAITMGEGNTYAEGLTVFALDQGANQAGIDAITSTGGNTSDNGKYLRDGRVIIVKDGRAYNVAGIEMRN